MKYYKIEKDGYILAIGIDIKGTEITKEEYDTVSSYMMLLGLENGYMQEHESADSSYVPDWNML